MAASELRAPGYPQRLTRADDAGQLAVARYLTLVLAALLAGLDQIALRQVNAYQAPSSPLGARLMQGSCVAALLVGGLVARRAGASFRALALALVVLSLLLSASGALWFHAIELGGPARSLAEGLPIATGLAAGVAAISLFRGVSGVLGGLDVVAVLLRPWRVLLASLLLVAYAALTTQVGLWRSAAALAMIGAVLALYAPTLQDFLSGERARWRGRWALRSLVALAAGAALGSYLLARSAVPSRALGVYPGDVVWRSEGGGPYTLVSVQQSFQLYTGSELRLSSLDGARYAEALVHPAFALAPRHARVLLLGLCTGLGEREILRYRGLEQLSSVCIDPSLSRLVRESSVLPRLSGELAPAELRWVEAEPIVWLASSAERFDVIVVDLPDPSGYLEGKYYTRYFYRLAAEHLAEGGVLVTQATSPSSSPITLSSVVRTMSGAGLATRVYSAAIPMLGDWGFVLGARAALPELGALSVETARVLGMTRYIDAPRLALLLATPPELTPGAPENTLDQQPIVDLLTEERRAQNAD